MREYSIKQKANHAVVFVGPDTMLRIQVLKDGLLRVTTTMSKEFVLRNEPMVINAESESVSWSLEEVEAGYWIVTTKLRVFLSRKGALRYETRSGELLTCEPDVDGRVLRPIDIVKMKYEVDAPMETFQSVDGLRQRAKGTPIIDRTGFQTKLSFVFQPEEAIYGLGQHEEGVLNYRGQHQFLYQHNLKVACPVLMSSYGWGILYNSCSAMTFHDDAMGSYLSSDADDEMDFFFMYGPEFDQIIHHLRHLTGDAAMLPRWALGYVQSKEHYRTQDELLAVAREYRKRGVPLDVIVQDWQSWPEGMWGQKSVDMERYPDLENCISELHEMGIKLMVSIWPNMGGDGLNWKEMNDNGHLLGNRTTYDAFSDKAREIYWNQTNEGLFSKGVDAWWCDCTEPFEADWNGPACMFPEDRMQVNVNEAKAYLDPTMINAYSLLHSQGLWDGQRKTTNEKRVVNLTRSGFPGQQRYATITWNGDVSATWETLRRSIPDGLNFCLSGQPYWTFDAGGFFVKRWEQWFGRGDYEEGCDDPAYRELYLRWFQTGAFLPMFRSHGTDTPREIWNFGEPGKEIYDALVETINLRMKLLPYLYSLIASATLKRDTPMRMLAFDFRQDRKALNVKDQFMLGRQLMVCPVLHPNAVSREVYLPKGKDWLDFYTGFQYGGGQTITVDTPLSHIPLFVVAGSILPMGPVRQHASDLPNAEIILNLYPGADGEFTFYEDEGDGYGYEKGEYALWNIRWNESEQKLTIECREGEYPNMPKQHCFVAQLPTGIKINIETNGQQKTEVRF